MSTSKSSDTERRYSDICGATNNRGDPCGLPAGWGTPGSGGDRCKFHGGLSSKNTDYLENNDHAVGNPGGGAPELNTNAEIHGGYASWEKAYKRLEGDAKEHVEILCDCMREDMEATDIPEQRREELIKERATLSILYLRAALDTFERGVLLEEEHEHEGETFTTTKANPTLTRTADIIARKRQIADELELY
jgi:hypothetical protein